jgi:cytochrome c oxidase cbb3-type subunit 3
MCLRFHKALPLIALGVLAAGCKREQTYFRPSPASLIVFNSAARESVVQPGGSKTEPHASNPYEGNAQGISEGQRLYNWYNCSGCHANGGGGMGPPLIKQTWIYGGEPENVFDTIVKGRPNGMPAWGGRIPEYEVWEIVTWIRAMNGLEPRSATPDRTDTLEQDAGTILKHPQQVTP